MNDHHSESNSDDDFYQPSFETQRGDPSEIRKQQSLNMPQANQTQSLITTMQQNKQKSGFNMGVSNSNSLRNQQNLPGMSSNLSVQQQQMNNPNKLIKFVRKQSKKISSNVSLRNSNTLNDTYKNIAESDSSINGNYLDSSNSQLVGNKNQSLQNQGVIQKNEILKISNSLQIQKQQDQHIIKSSISPRINTQQQFPQQNQSTLQFKHGNTFQASNIANQSIQNNPTNSQIKPEQYHNQNAQSLFKGIINTNTQIQSQQQQNHNAQLIRGIRNQPNSLNLQGLNANIGNKTHYNNGFGVSSNRKLSINGTNDNQSNNANQILSFRDQINNKDNIMNQQKQPDQSSLETQQQQVILSYLKQSKEEEKKSYEVSQEEPEFTLNKFSARSIQTQKSVQSAQLNQNQSQVQQYEEQKSSQNNTESDQIFNVECSICNKTVNLNDLDQHEKNCQVKADEQFIQDSIRQSANNDYTNIQVSNQSLIQDNSITNNNISRKILNLGDIHSSRSNFRYNNQDNNRYANNDMETQLNFNVGSSQQVRVEFTQSIQNAQRQSRTMQNFYNSGNSNQFVQLNLRLENHSIVNMNEDDVESPNFHNMQSNEDQGRERQVSSRYGTTEQLPSTQQYQFERSTRPPIQPMQNPSAVPSTYLDDRRGSDSILNGNSSTTNLNGRYNIQLNNDLKDDSMEDDIPDRHQLIEDQFNLQNYLNLGNQARERSAFEDDGDQEDNDNSNTYNVGIYDSNSSQKDEVNEHDQYMKDGKQKMKLPNLNDSFGANSNVRGDFDSSDYQPINSLNDLNLFSHGSGVLGGVSQHLSNMRREVTGNRHIQRYQTQNDYNRQRLNLVNSDDDSEDCEEDDDENSFREMGMSQERIPQHSQFSNIVSNHNNPMRFSAGGFRGIRELINERHSKSHSPQGEGSGDENDNTGRDQLFEIEDHDTSQDRDRRLQELRMFRAGLFDIISDEELNDSFSLIMRRNQALEQNASGQINQLFEQNNLRNSSLSSSGNNYRPSNLVRNLMRPSQAQLSPNHRPHINLPSQFRIDHGSSSEEEFPDGNMLPSYVVDEVDGLQRRIRDRNNIRIAGGGLHHFPQSRDEPSHLRQPQRRIIGLDGMLRLPADSMEDFIDHSRGSDNDSDIEEESKFDDYEALINLDEDVVQSVPKKLIEQLPTSKFTEGNKANFSEENKSCTICMCQYEVEEMFMILPCLHRFHSECIREWFSRRNTCPNCKDRVCDHFEEELKSMRQPRQSQVLNLMQNRLHHLQNNRNRDPDDFFPNDSLELYEDRGEEALEDDYHIRFSANDNSAIPSINFNFNRQSSINHSQFRPEMFLRQPRIVYDDQNQNNGFPFRRMEGFRPRGFQIRDLMQQQRYNDIQNNSHNDDNGSFSYMNSINEGNIEEFELNNASFPRRQQSSHQQQPSLIADPSQIPQSIQMQQEHDLNEMLINLRMRIGSFNRQEDPIHNDEDEEEEELDNRLMSNNMFRDSERRMYQQHMDNDDDLDIDSNNSSNQQANVNSQQQSNSNNN